MTHKEQKYWIKSNQIYLNQKIM